MFGFFKRPASQLLAQVDASQVDAYYRLHPEADMVVAMEAWYAPHGGREVFWLYRDGDWFDGHAAHTAQHGGLRVRRCRVPLADVNGPIQEAGFFGLEDAQSNMIDGLTYRIAVATKAGSHCVFGAQGADGPQLKLFDALTGLFK